MQMITYFNKNALLFYAILRKDGRVYMGYSKHRSEAREFCEELVTEHEEKENTHGQSERVVH